MENRKTLLLDASYQTISFISERKVLKLFVKEKVEVISEWKDIVIVWGSGQMKHPAIVRLKHHVRRNYFNSNFSRKAAVKRDNSTCLVPNTNILMHDGSFKKIKDIQINDKVIDAYGNIQTVEYINIRNIAENILEIKVRGNGNFLKCTTNHKILTTDWKNTSLNMDGIKAENLTTQNYLFNIIPILSGKYINDDLLLYNNHLPYVKITEKTIKNYCGNITNRFFRYDYDLGKLIGFFLSEGSCDGRQIGFHFHIKEKKYANEVKSIMKKVFNLTGCEIIHEKEHKRDVMFGSIFLCNLLKKLCYHSYDDNIKGLNDKQYGVDFLRGVLYGMLCGDGHFDKKHKKVVLHIKLYNLLNDMLIISNLLNIYPTVSKDGVHPDGKMYKTLCFNSDNYNKIIALCNKKIPEWKSSKFSKNDRNIIGNMIISKIQWIKQFYYIGDVYDLQISGSHTYIANGIAVHNCMYCDKKLSASQITIDHIVPRAQGGITSFTNCVVSCHTCNNQKADRTPEQAGMKLLRKPTHPSFQSHYFSGDLQEYWFDGWSDFIGG